MAVKGTTLPPLNPIDDDDDVKKQPDPPGTGNVTAVTPTVDKAPVAGPGTPGASATNAKLAMNNPPENTPLYGGTGEPPPDTATVTE